MTRTTAVHRPCLAFATGTQVHEVPVAAVLHRGGNTVCLLSFTTVAGESRVACIFGRDRSPSIHDGVHGTELARLEGVTSRFETVVAFQEATGHGRIMTFNDDGRIYLWDGETGALLQSLWQMLTGYVVRPRELTAYVDEDYRVHIVGMSGSVHIWRVEGEASDPWIRHVSVACPAHMASSATCLLPVRTCLLRNTLVLGYVEQRSPRGGLHFYDLGPALGDAVGVRPATKFG
jgi:WD40 repeat protein